MTDKYLLIDELKASIRVSRPKEKFDFMRVKSKKRYKLGISIELFW